MDNNNLSVYPALGYETTDNGSSGHFTTKAGISQRTLIAAMCLQGLLASWGQHDLTNTDDLANDAVLFADALLTHLENTSK